MGVLIGRTESTVRKKNQDNQIDHQGQRKKSITLLSFQHACPHHNSLGRHKTNQGKEVLMDGLRQPRGRKPPGDRGGIQKQTVHLQGSGRLLRQDSDLAPEKWILKTEKTT